MKYAIRADVEGLLFLEAPNSSVTVEVDGVVFEATSDASGRVQSIRVVLPVRPDVAEGMRATLGPKPADPNRAPPLTFQVDERIDELAQRHLLAIESVLSFDVARNALVRVRWREGAMSLIPETEQEQERIHVWDVQVSEPFPRTATTLTPSLLQKVASDAKQYEDLAEPMAFLREGVGREAERDFIQAFYSYYFVIEGLYADGKTGEKEVLKKFDESVIFRNVCEVVLKSYQSSPQTAKALAALKPLFASNQCDLTPRGLQKFLFRMRGQLHHFSRRSSRTQPHPFNQHLFDPVARLTGFVAQMVIVLEKMRLDREASKGGPDAASSP